MKICKISILIFYAAIILILATMNVTAEIASDEQGDVRYYEPPYWKTQNVTNQPNVDIKEISAVIKDDKITLSMTLWPDGLFNRSENEYVVYRLFVNTSDAMYQILYTDAAGEGAATGIASGILIEDIGGAPLINNISVNSSTINSTLDLIGESTTVGDLIGTAWMYEYFDPMEQENGKQWLDYIGNYDFTGEFEPVVDEEDDKEDEDEEVEEDKGIPGFEIIIVIFAIVATLIIMRRRKSGGQYR